MKNANAVKTNEAVSTETPKTAAQPSTEVKPIVTPVEDRLFELTPKAKEMTEVKFRGKQRQITFDAVKAAGKPVTSKDISKTCEAAGLKAVAGVEPSVRYHLHHLTKDGYLLVTNPTTELV